MIFVIVAEQTIISVTTGVNTRVNINTNQPTVQSSLRPRSSKIYFTLRKFIEFCLNSVAFNPNSFSLPLSFYSRFRSHFFGSILSRTFLINDKIPSVPGWWLVLQLIIAFLSVSLFSRKKLTDTAEKGKLKMREIKNILYNTDRFQPTVILQKYNMYVIISINLL